MTEPPAGVVFWVMGLSSVGAAVVFLNTYVSPKVTATCAGASKTRRAATKPPATGAAAFKTRRRIPGRGRVGQQLAWIASMSA